MPIHSLIDLSHTLTPSTPNYPGDPPFTCHRLSTIPTSGYNLHSLSLTSHTGTHLDAPFHFYEDGITVDKIPLDMLVGKILVIDLTTKLKAEGRGQRICWDDVKEWESKMKEGVIVLFHTGWSKYWCAQKYFDHPFLDRGAAEMIMKTGVRVLGVDTLSPDQTRVEEPVENPRDFGVHEVVLGSGGIIIENLTNLGKIADIGGDGFRGSFVPLSIGGCDGSPIRAFAWQET